MPFTKSQIMVSIRVEISQWEEGRGALVFFMMCDGVPVWWQYIAVVTIIIIIIIIRV
jgi:hypothetical protein